MPPTGTPRMPGGGVGAKGGPGRGRPGGGHGPMGRYMNTDKPKDFKGTMRKFLKFIAQYKLHVILIAIFSIGSTVFAIIGPKVMSTATTELFEGLVAKINGTGGIDFHAIALILLATLALYGVAALFTFGQGWLLAGMTQKMCYQLREQLEQKIHRVPFGTLDSTSTGDTLSRITNDVDTLGMTLNQSLTQVITSTVTIVGVLAMMLYINVVMTLVALLVIPVAVLLIKFVVKRSQKYFFAQQNMLGVINGLVEETFSGHTVVRAFNQEEATLEGFQEANDHLYDVGWKAVFASSFMKPVMDFVGNFGYVIIAVLGGVFCARGAITVGDIQAFIQYVKNFMQPISQLTQISNVLQQMAAAAERIFEFLDEPEESPDAAPGRADAENAPCEGTEPAASSDIRTEEPDAACSVEFRHVRFGYSPDKPVIHDFSARVGHGQTVALVGPTGAGKTTMVKLLMRFYDVDDGAILVEGRDIRSYSRADIRSRFGMVLQDTWLFNGTIRENIRYGKLDATDQEVEDAARAGFAHHFIMTLPGGYDFVINEAADNISAGQRQLLTIARAILANRDMLILDEATSSVDTRTELRIQQAMDHLMEGRTSFVIAHRLSTIRNADLILVMQEGDIVEQGTHEELLARNGFYADLYNSQFEEV